MDCTAKKRKKIEKENAAAAWAKWPNRGLKKRNHIFHIDPMD
jgi:hypothetical protein